MIYTVEKHHILEWEGRRIELEAGDVVTAAPIAEEIKKEWYALKTRRHVLKPGGLEAALAVDGLLADHKKKKAKVKRS